MKCALHVRLGVWHLGAGVGDLYNDLNWCLFAHNAC
jgi:hypothetical protein